MALINESDLHFPNRYNWTIKKSVTLFYSPLPGHAIFNRHEGYEVLNFINSTIRQYNLCDITSVEKIETMLINLPFEEQTHSQVGEWVMKYWNKKVPFLRNSTSDSIK